MALTYSPEEIAEAQAALDFHPDVSPFWDTHHAQELLRIVRQHKLTATNTNRERCAIYAAAKAAA